MINYIKGNLFDASMDSLLVHSISSDARMGAGIAKQFAAKYPIDVRLMQNRWRELGLNANILGDNYYTPKTENMHAVVHMFAKAYASRKPDSHDLLYECLDKAFQYAKDNGFDSISMPLVGSGLDAIYSRGINGVDWKKISEKIENMSKLYGVDIFVYYI